MKQLLVYALSLCTVLLAGCNNGNDGLLDVPGGWSHKAESLAVTPKTADIPVGLTQQLQADAILENGQIVRVTTDSFLTWSSSDDTVAFIDEQGLVTGLTTGTVTIIALGTNNDGTTISDTATITVSDAMAVSLTITPKTKTLVKGLTQAYRADVLMSDGRVIDVTTNTALTWSSTKVGVATISNGTDKGLAQSVDRGTTTVKAEGTVNGVTLSDTATLTVSDTTVARLEVTPVSASVPVGLEQQFTAEVVMTDNTTQDVTELATWSSDSPSTALVSDDVGTKGIATGKGVSPANAPATISASIDVEGTTYTDSGTLTITDAVITEFHVTPETASIPNGLSQDFIAKVTLSNGRVLDVTSNANVSWTSSNNNTASVSNDTATKGKATGHAVGGPVTITATGIVNGQTYQDSAQLTVTNATVSSLQVTPSIESTPIGLSKQFTATATMSDSTIIDVTESVDWMTDDSDIATISNILGSKGKTKGESEGTVVVTAMDSLTSISAIAELTVTPTVLTSLQVTPSSASITKGLTQQFIATAFFSDSSHQDVTTDPAVSWTSSNPTNVTVTNKGAATGNEVGGPFSITATKITSEGEPISDSAQITVTDALDNYYYIIQVGEKEITDTSDPSYWQSRPVGITDYPKIILQMFNEYPISVWAYKVEVRDSTLISRTPMACTFEIPETFPLFKVDDGSSDASDITGDAFAFKYGGINGGTVETEHYNEVAILLRDYLTNDLTKRDVKIRGKATCGEGEQKIEIPWLTRTIWAGRSE